MRKQNPHRPLTKYPIALINAVRDITNQDEDQCKKIIDAAIKSGETSNCTKDISYWTDEYLYPNTVKITADDYDQMLSDALQTLHSQCRANFNGSIRTLFTALNDKITGYSMETGVVKLANKHNVYPKVAHQEGNPTDFYATDFPEVIENGITRRANINIGAKGSGVGALWLEVSLSQFIKSNFHIFAKSLSQKDHFYSYFNEYFMSNSLHMEKLVNKGYLEHSLAKELAKDKFEPVFVYVVGYAENNKTNNEFKYKGKMGRNTYTINEYEGFLPKNYKEIIRKNEDLDEKTKVAFRGIGKFAKSDKTELQIYNLGSIKKTSEEFKSLFNKM